MQLISLFSIPVWNSKLPFFDKEYKKNILKILDEYKKKNTVSSSMSGVNSYQSDKNLHSEKQLSEIFEYIYFICHNAFCDLNLDKDIYDMYITSSWFNYNNKRESMNQCHSHDGLFSGVVYINCPPESGNLCIFNKGMNNLWIGNKFSDKKNQFTSEKVNFTPEDGEVFIWPSYLLHSVETNNHDENRISISFECTIMEKQVKDV